MTTRPKSICVEWLIHLLISWSYVPHEWLPGPHLIWLQHTSGLVRSSPVSYSIPVTNYGGAQGTRTLLLQIMSLACSQYTTRPVRRMRDRWARRIGYGADAATEARSPVGAGKPHMYDDMRRIRTQVLLPLLRNIDDMGWSSGSWLLDCLSRLLSARYPPSGTTLIRRRDCGRRTHAKSVTIIN